MQNLLSTLARSPKSAGAAAYAEESLPVWRLDDLYSGLDSPQYKADLAQVARDCRAFSARYRDALAQMLAAPDASGQIGEAIIAYEKIDDLITKIMSFAGLSYAEN